MDKLEQAAARVDRILEAATWEVKLNDMVSSKKIKEDEAVKLAIVKLKKMKKANWDKHMVSSK